MDRSSGKRSIRCWYGGKHLLALQRAIEVMTRAACSTDDVEDVEHVTFHPPTNIAALLRQRTWDACSSTYKRRAAQTPMHNCVCCEQVFFRTELHVGNAELQDTARTLVPQLAHSIRFDGSHICQTCYHSLQLKKIPALSTLNKVFLAIRPQAIYDPGEMASMHNDNAVKWYFPDT